MSDEHGASVTGTCLFTDLVGFTQYTEAVGDAAAVEVLERQTAMATDAIAGCEQARIVKELGDGLLVWFGVAAQALDATGALMAAVVDAREAGSFPLSVRMGVHHGPARARGTDLVGLTINIGARIADLAGPGEVLVSEHAVAAAPSARAVHGLEPVGPVLVKGVRDPIWLQRLQT